MPGLWLAEKDVGAVAHQASENDNWEALTQYLLDGDVPIDNNHIENQMRPWAMGRNKANSSFMRTGASGSRLSSRFAAASIA